MHLGLKSKEGLHLKDAGLSFSVSVKLSEERKRRMDWVSAPNTFAFTENHFSVNLLTLKEINYPQQILITL